MGLKEHADGQTLLDEDEKEGLLIRTVATREELDEFEQQNIEQAMLWTLSRSFKPEAVFTEDFMRSLHRRMFGNVWSWAGEFRRTNKNIGLDKWKIATALKTLLNDAKCWYAEATYEPDEFVIRFKHRLVSIHCFPNGNGRHSRLTADLMIDKIFNRPVYTWGAADLSRKGDLRKAYLAAVKTADKGEFGPLILFARS